MVYIDLVVVTNAVCAGTCLLFSLIGGAYTAFLCCP